jgi:hypothetical protein
MQQVTRPIVAVAGGLVLAAGLFWAGRESTHGLGAFWEHWWCPSPVVLALLGLGALFTTRLTAGRASPGA